MEAKLIVIGGDVKTTEISLKLPCIVGRGRGAGIMLPHPLVSRQHCEIYEHEGQLVVRDLGSLNGTYINNTRLTQATLLPTGDLLTIGTVTFRAEYSVDPNMQPPEPGAQTVKIGKGLPTQQATSKSPAADVPDFSAFDEEDEIAEVEPVEEDDEPVTPRAPASATPAREDDFVEDVMALLDDEIEE